MACGINALPPHNTHWQTHNLTKLLYLSTLSQFRVTRNFSLLSTLLLLLVLFIHMLYVEKYFIYFQCINYWVHLDRFNALKYTHFFWSMIKARERTSNFWIILIHFCLVQNFITVSAFLSSCALKNVFSKTHCYWYSQ